MATEWYDINEEPQMHTVMFNLGDHGVRTGGGRLMQSVTNACDAMEPEVVSTNGWAFTGWNCPFTNVTSDLTVTAQYERLKEKVDYYVFRGWNALQNTIEMAEDGSTILVFDGGYGPIDTFNKTLTIRSVNGPEKTFITGQGERCALLGVIRCRNTDGVPYSAFDLYIESFGTTLEGFTLKGGSSRESECIDAFGGGVAGGTLRNCRIVGCTAYLGGGAFQSSLIRCEIRSCWVDSLWYDDWSHSYVSQHTGLGGGAYECVLDNCLVHQCSADGDAGGCTGCDVYSSTVAGNDLAAIGYINPDTQEAFFGGCSAGVNFCNVSNSVVWGNVATVWTTDEDGRDICVDFPNNWSYIGGEYVGDVSNNGLCAYNCTWPMPTGRWWWTNNITNDPQFVDAELGDYHLKQTSPCVDAGGWSATNAVVDLDGRPRVSGVAPDMGAYEYQHSVDPIPELATNVPPEQVAAALSGSADGGLVENITNAMQYAAYREWALAVKDVAGVSVAGARAVKDSPYAWLSFALGADKLIGREIASNEVRIVSFAAGEASSPASGNGDAQDMRFAFEVSVDGVNIGGGTVSLETLKENLKKVLLLEGAVSLAAGTTFSSDNIDVIFDTPVDGKARFTASPLPNAGNTFFMRVKVNGVK